MTSRKIRAAGISVFLLATIAWLYGGAQIGFYKTFYRIMEIDEITQIEYPVEVEAFLPGIETLAAGTLALVAAFILSSFVEGQEPRSKET